MGKEFTSCINDRFSSLTRSRSVVGFIPFVGYVTIMLSEHPWLKPVMLGMMGLVVVLQRE